MSQTAAPRILVVDDEPAILLSHSVILQRQGYAVATAATFASGVELASGEEFDLLICDLSLDHGASGFDLIKIALERTPEMPVILLTGYSDTEVPAQYSACRVRLISKPAAIPELLDTVKSLLGREQENQNRTAAD